MPNYASRNNLYYHDKNRRNAGRALSFVLIPKWEFFARSFLFCENEEKSIPQYSNVQTYGKYMFWVNAQNNGGGTVFFGFGKSHSLQFFYKRIEFPDLFATKVVVHKHFQTGIFGHVN